MPDSRKLSPPIIVMLLVAAALAVVAVMVGPTAVILPLAFLAALVCAGIAVLISRRLAYLRRNQNFGRRQAEGSIAVPANQWFVLAIGLTVISTLAGFGAAWQAVSEPPKAPQVAAPVPSVLVPVGLPSPTDSPSPSDFPSPTETPDVEQSGESGVEESPTPDPDESFSPEIAYLDSMDRINGSSSAGPVYLSAKRYPRSIQMYCYGDNGGFSEWNVAGRSTFSATLGIADDAEDVFGALAEFIFYDEDSHQLGRAISVSVGHPQAVQLNLTSVVRLRITCTGRSAKTNAARSFYAALGNAYVKS